MLSNIILRSTAAFGGAPFCLKKCTALGSARAGAGADTAYAADAAAYTAAYTTARAAARAARKEVVEKINQWFIERIETLEVVK